MKKKLLLICLLAVFMAANGWAAGTTAVTTGFPKVGRDDSVAVSITVTADATAATIPNITFKASTTTAIDEAWKWMQSRWLTNLRTTPGHPAPTANYDIFIIDEDLSSGGYLLTTPTLAIGSTASAVSSVYFNFSIDGTSYSKAAVAAGTAPGTSTVVTSKYGAVAFDIGANGTIDAVPAAANGAGYTTALLAIAGVPAAASDHVRMGYVTVIKSDGTFTFGTTNFDAANVTTAYLNIVHKFDILGGALANRSTTVAESVYPKNTSGDNAYRYVMQPWTIVFLNNSVNSAVMTLYLEFH